MFDLSNVSTFQNPPTFSFIVLWFFFVFFKNCLRLPEDMYSVMKITCRQKTMLNSNKNPGHCACVYIIWWNDQRIKRWNKLLPSLCSLWHLPSTYGTSQCSNAPAGSNCQTRLWLFPLVKTRKKMKHFTHKWKIPYVLVLLQTS